MSNPEYLRQLLDAAKAKAGSDYKVAQMLEVPRSHLSNWRNGIRPIPPEEQAALAELAGFDPVQALCRAHIERHEGTKKGEKLRQLLGKAVHQTGAASASFIAGLALISWASAEVCLIRCIERLSGNRTMPRAVYN